MHQQCVYRYMYMCVDVWGEGLHNIVTLWLIIHRVQIWE
jgi:hypothetical protein